MSKALGKRPPSFPPRSQKEYEAGLISRHKHFTAALIEAAQKLESLSGKTHDQKEKIIIIARKLRVSAGGEEK